MNIGSNNTLTYLSPSTWWAKVFPFLGKCQNLEYEKQYVYQGVRFFDLRLTVNEHNDVVVKNGIVTYEKWSLYGFLGYLNSKGDVTLRVMLDITFDGRLSDNYRRVEKRFIEFCRIIEEVYPSIMYIGGERLYDRHKLFEFKYEKKYGKPTIIEVNETLWLFRLFPMLNAYMNKRMIRKYKDKHGFLLLNFVEKK